MLLILIKLLFCTMLHASIPVRSPTRSLWFHIASTVSKHIETKESGPCSMFSLWLYNAAPNQHHLLSGSPPMLARKRSEGVRFNISQQSSHSPQLGLLWFYTYLLMLMLWINLGLGYLPSPDRHHQV